MKSKNMLNINWKSVFVDNLPGDSTYNNIPR